MKPESTRVFTIEEANNMLPLVKPIVEDILKAGNEMKDMSRQTMTCEHAIRLENRITELKAYLQELEDLGCSYKDWNFKAGIVDFPGELNGEPVLFCWKSDEPSVAHYHADDETYEDRKLIPQTVLL